MSGLLDIQDDLETCIIRVSAIGLMAEGLVKSNRQAGNAFARAADDLCRELGAVRDGLQAEVDRETRR